MASAVEKPVIVLLHGAWHQPVHFDSFASQLRLEGFEVLVPRLASAGPDNEIIGKTLQDDVQVIHDTIKPYLNRGRQIVLVSHSLSGMTATDSAIGYTVTDRTDICQPGGIKAIIYISAVAPPMAGMYGLQMRTYEDVPPEWWQVEGEFATFNDKMPEYLYHDVDPDVAATALKDLVKQSLESLKSPCKHAASDVTAPKTYVVCEEDKGVKLELQVSMAEAGGCEIVRLSCGHMPFLKDKETAELIGIVKKVAK